MESISTFDIFKIGVGPSSSHTMGPWRAAQRFLKKVREREGGTLSRVKRVRIDLYGSLAKTGRGHGTDVAVLLGLSGEDPETCVVEGLVDRASAIIDGGRMRLAGERSIDFRGESDLVFHMEESLPFHPNGLRFTAFFESGPEQTETYYSVGGGFVVQEDEQLKGHRATVLPYPAETAADIEEHCRRSGLNIAQAVMANELAWRNEEQVRAGLLRIWAVMKECIWRGCHTPGILPGGLNVARRAPVLNEKILTGKRMNAPADKPPVPPSQIPSLEEWMRAVRHSTSEFRAILKWVSAFALAVNEENAAFGRVVTAPTNGAAGVIPAVLMYAWCFLDTTEEAVIDFMLTAAQIGILFKKGATISAAMGGCQAEIGVSSAMAAAGLAQILGGSVGQVMMAAEIAMEHHLGMTCDPIAGLVQVPCIERNTMGAIKAITAANMAVEQDPTKAKVSLDGVIRTMWATAQDMQSKYKETAEGGLAVHVPVSISEC